MKVAMAIAFGPLLVGCAQTYWAHPSKSPQEFYADSNDCLTSAHQAIPVRQIQPPPPQSPFTAPLIGDALMSGYTSSYNAGQISQANAQRQQMYEHCVRARGWYTYTR